MCSLVFFNLLLFLFLVIAVQSVRDMVCTEFIVGSIESSYIPSNNATSKDPAMSLSVSGISATCSGQYKSTGMSGKVKAIVENNDAPMRHPMTFVSSYWKDQIRMATSVVTEKCVAPLKVPSHNGIKFSGSISAKLIDLFAGPIAKYVSSALEKELCPLIQSNLDPILTKAIDAADDYMKHLIPDNTDQGEDGIMVRSAEATVSTSDLLDFAMDTPLLTRALDLANDNVDR